MRRRTIDVSKWNPRRPPGKALDPEAKALRATPTEQALARQMAESDRREERWRYEATDPIDST
jgi:hypothetical protein